MGSDLEIFSALAPQWWDEKGPFSILHTITPQRIQWILETVKGAERVPEDTRYPLKGLQVLDVGCGGGLVSEPLARLGACVTGIDILPQNIEVAQQHAQAVGLNITYRVAEAEVLVAEGQKFDVVVGYEIIEHVDYPEKFLHSLCQLVNDSGFLVLSTLNRTIASYALGIFAAERILKWVPKGTHLWSKFIRPRELQQMLYLHGFTEQAYKGLSFHPLSQNWLFSKNLEVNYFVSSCRHKKGIQHFDGDLTSWG